MIDQPDRLAEIRQRRAAIGKGNWTHLPDIDPIAGHDIVVNARVREEADDRWVEDDGVVAYDEGVITDETGRFIAHAPDDIDYLLKWVERLRGLLGRLEWDANGYCTICDAPSPAQTGGDGHRPDCELAAVLRST